ncbi:glycoside hydrolase domain-containing protein [Clostridium estertheticum]|uniref:glycoside hydrolase domain-containing protein n=1 Tax=Clostridium estertheticum TaxID=238834 RepID=UPI00286937C6|nr:glycoside hydrolase domain-containing protein [Clostridium estertheticum]
METQTWASLLVSTGDPSRKGAACDCATTITSEKATTLKNNGYELVGRYLTGNFKMMPSELQTIFANGLKVFPIYETSLIKQISKTEISINWGLAGDPFTISGFYDIETCNIFNFIISYF